MDRRSLQNMMLLIVLILVQVLVCNHIILFNIAIPFIYIYVIIRLPMIMKTGWVLTWAFFAGLVVDIFSDTPGVNTTACLIIAAIRRPTLFAYIPKDDRTKDIVPSVANLGLSIYAKYLLTITLIFCFLVFGIEFGSMFLIKEWMIVSCASAAFSFLLMLGIDCLMVKRIE